jgi:hypothetical protein
MLEVEKKAYEKRLNIRNNFNENLIKKKQFKCGNTNFMSLENYGDLLKYHFLNNNVPFLNNTNYSSKKSGLNDFRDGSFFKQEFIKQIEKHKQIILYQIYIDGTKIGSKEIVNVYLTILNDDLVPGFTKKFIYNLAFINKKNLLLDQFLLFIFSKLKNECEIGVEINGMIVPAFMFSFIGDNAEVYSCLNLKISFSKSTFACRVCDKNTIECSEKKKENYNNFNIKSNKWYNHEVIQRNLSKENEKYYCATAISNIFILKHVDYICSFPLDLQHLEMEGELFRHIILVFINYPDFFQTTQFTSMINYLKKFIQIDNILLFFRNVEMLRNKIYNNVLQLPYKNFKLTSGETNLVFNIVPFFFYDFFKNNLSKYFIRSFILHKKYLEIVTKDKITENELNFMDFIIKEIIFLFLDNGVKVTTKNWLTCHYSLYTRALGPLKKFFFIN